MAQGSKVQGSGFWVLGSGFWVLGSKIRNGTRNKAHGSRFDDKSIIKIFLISVRCAPLALRPLSFALSVEPLNFDY